MDKQSEIKTLQSLKGDTYFNQYFNDSDIDLMCENIRNDFAIEGGTQFAAEASNLRKQLKEQRQSFRDDMKQMVAEAIAMPHDPAMENMFAGYIGKMALIKVKRENNVPLTSEEIDYLINKAEENK